ncbi:MAG TPA: endonuclease/exonuclease/phosphatase family protein [Bacteroidales bacterium]|nr:endonuclease/exonuclease/phosphatase family protein [Bacteroidales bacterium]
MRNKLLFRLIVATLIVGLFFLVSCKPNENDSIRLISYNIRFDNPDDGLNAWPNRKEYVAQMVKFYGVDLLGVQEALHHQLRDIMSMLDGYEYVGVGRDDGDTLGEYSVIIYRAQRFQLQFTGTFWLSETPDAPSLGWDAACKRVCSWAIFKDRNSAKTFAMFNTHFDHVGKVARQNSAKLLLNRIATIANSIPVLVTGDFNMIPTDSTISIIASVYADTYNLSPIGHYGPVGTWNGFDYNSPLTDRIDYCFVDSSKVDILRHAHIDDAFRQRFPSDHLPVLVELRLK